MLLREAERRLGVCWRLAEAMPDRRDPDRVRHAMFEMVMARASAIACGYADAIDLDRLRHDPLLKVAVGRCPQTGAPLASQSTISHLENAPSKTAAGRLSAALLDQFGATVHDSYEMELPAVTYEGAPTDGSTTRHLRAWLVKTGAVPQAQPGGDSKVVGGISFFLPARVSTLPKRPWEPELH